MAPYIDAEDIFEKYEVEVNGDFGWKAGLRWFEFHNIIRAMGWANVREFTRDTGCTFDDVKDHVWQVSGFPSRIFILK